MENFDLRFILFSELQWNELEPVTPPSLGLGMQY